MLSTHQELLVGLAQLRVTQKEDPGVLVRQRARLVQKVHIRIFEVMIPLFAIARAARGHQILPRTLPTARTRDNMIESQFARALPAILAGILIAEQDIGACGLQGHAWNTHIDQQLHDYRALQLQAPGLNTLLDQLADALIHESHLLLGQKNDEAALKDDREGLERRIQYKNRHE